MILSPGSGCSKEHPSWSLCSFLNKLREQSSETKIVPRKVSGLWYLWNLNNSEKLAKDSSRSRARRLPMVRFCLRPILPLFSFRNHLNYTNLLKNNRKFIKISQKSPKIINFKKFSWFYEIIWSNLREYRPETKSYHRESPGSAPWEIFHIFFYTI